MSRTPAIKCKYQTEASRRGKNEKRKAGKRKRHRVLAPFSSATTANCKFGPFPLSRLPAFPALFHPIKGLLKDLPILHTFELFHSGRIHSGLFGIFSWAVDLVEDAEITRKRLIGKLVGGGLIRHVVACRDEIKSSALARIGSVKGAFVKLDAFAEAFDKAEPVMVHRGLHHLHDMIWIGVGRARHEGCPGGNRLLHGVNRVIDSTPGIGFALETQG